MTEACRVKGDVDGSERRWVAMYLTANGLLEMIQRRPVSRKSSLMSSGVCVGLFTPDRGF